MTSFSLSLSFIFGVVVGLEKVEPEMGSAMLQVVVVVVAVVVVVVVSMLMLALLTLSNLKPLAGQTMESL